MRNAVLVPTRPRPGSHSLLTALLVAAFVCSALAVDVDGASGGAAAACDLLLSVLQPDLSPALVATVAEATVLTAYAVAGMSVAILLGVPGALVASGVLSRRRAVSAVVPRGR